MKTSYERFIEANNSLVKCFESVSADKWKQLSTQEQSGLCADERQTVQTFFNENSIGFKNLL